MRMGARLQATPGLPGHIIFPKTFVAFPWAARWSARHREESRRGNVVLEPDVAAEFRTAEEVNETLRALAGILRRRKERRTRKPENKGSRL